jgi:hypothetical protein
VFLNEWAASLPCAMGERSRTDKGTMNGIWGHRRRFSTWIRGG